MSEQSIAWVVGGGTAGHIEPALAVGEALRRARPGIDVRAVGTPRGMEGRIVPARGFDLELVDPVPLPRKVNADLFKLPFRLVKAIAGTRSLIRKAAPGVVVGFGGYACVPVYLTLMLMSRRSRPPVVVHEANASAGLANKLGVRIADSVMAAVPGSGLEATVVGNPVREAITGLDRSALRAEAREFFGLGAEGTVVLVVGGSQGAASLNKAFAGAADDFRAAGIGVLHATGEGKGIDLASYPGDVSPGYVQVPYISRMDLAYAAADLVVCRSGAMTVAEVSAVGLPAVFVPLPIGNGEQALNARTLVSGGAAVQIPDGEFTAERIRDEVLPLAADSARLKRMSEAALGAGSRDAADEVAGVALGLLDSRSRT
ncbi:undecaprenyldiphospho-muramoylpentapeptide beta-N-acetylglucosaminyltransferase [Dietzia sp.]|uniref:undecaprenyldiphospho-muramoylpentapeptide beta-N-acetylglucosaminyltransferase n=1 Tax=Dietzia sp. TaxID=1871616 RepID=UPI002FDA9D7C